MAAALAVTIQQSISGTVLLSLDTSLVLEMRLLQAFPSTRWTVRRRSSMQQHVLLAICRPSGCTVVSGVVVVVVGVCNHSQMRNSKYTCLIFGVSMGLDPS